jgi:hypothetical protein
MKKTILQLSSFPAQKDIYHRFPYETNFIIYSV